MPATAPTPESLVERLERENPYAVRLAEAVSLAARVEPELLRAARLELIPEAQACDEADLWFSPLIASRTADWLVLEPLVAQELRSRLANEPERMKASRRLIIKAHRGGPRTLLIEEDIAWLAVSSAEGATEAIEAHLRGVLGRLLEDPEANRALARWFAAAARRLPAQAQTSEAYSLLLFVTSALFYGRYVGELGWRKPQFIEKVAALLPKTVAETRIWVAITNRGLTFRPEEGTGFKPIDLPRTNPLLLELCWQSGRRKIVALRRFQASSVDTEPGWVEIRTVAGRVYLLKPRYISEATALPPTDFQVEPLPEKGQLKIAANEDFEARVLADQSESKTELVLIESKPLGPIQVLRQTTEVYKRSG